MFIINIYNLSKDKLLKFNSQSKEEILNWRAILRPTAVIFPILYFFYDKKIILTFIGILFLIFFIADFIRLISKRFNLLFFKKTKTKIKSKF